MSGLFIHDLITTPAHPVTCLKPANHGLIYLLQDPDDCTIHCLYRPLEGIISTKNAATVSVNMLFFSFIAHHQQYSPHGG